MAKANSTARLETKNSGRHSQLAENPGEVEFLSLLAQVIDKSTPDEMMELMIMMLNATAETTH